jgi:hypothetical protein
MGHGWQRDAGMQETSPQGDISACIPPPFSSVSATLAPGGSRIRRDAQQAVYWLEREDA